MVYKNTKEGNLYLDVYYPTNCKLINLLIIIYADGGGWTIGSKMGAGNSFFAKVFEKLTKKGFCIVSVDYRLYRKGQMVTPCATV